MKRILSVFIVLILLGVIGAFFWKKTPVSIEKSHFSHLPHWGHEDLTPSFNAFLQSCDVFLRQEKTKSVGSSTFPLTVNDFMPACLAGKALTKRNPKTLMLFFEKWFEPTYFSQGANMAGVFTGYYLPTLKGSWDRTADYSYPIYQKPKDLVSIDLGLFDKKFDDKHLTGRKKGKKIVPYFDRESINAGALDKKSKPILWVSDKVDRFFLEVQGSGYVSMTDGSKVVLGYAGQNGRSYTSIGRYLIKKGAFDKAHASMQSIRQYLTAHPNEIDEVLNQNKSFIFFKVLKNGLVLGSQGAALTPGYSLAVDKKYIPFGLPVWLTTDYPVPNQKETQQLNRLMVAQDTGGAIKGHVRGDVFWGDLPHAAYHAGHMNSKGNYWLLLPKK